MPSRAMTEGGRMQDQGLTEGDRMQDRGLTEEGLTQDRVLTEEVLMQDRVLTEDQGLMADRGGKTVYSCKKAGFIPLFLCCQVECLFLSGGDDVQIL